MFKVLMMADAFSMFDYGGGFDLAEGLSWVLVFLVVTTVFQLGTVWCSFSYFNLAAVKVVLFFNSLLGKSSSLMGFGLFCSSVFIYLSAVSVISIFPYSFCVTAHFSHNISISLVLWLTSLLISFSVNARSSLATSVPSGLSWAPAGVVGVFEMVSILSRSLTLGSRLTMNMIAGKLILCIGSSFLGSVMVSGNLVSSGGLLLLSGMLILMMWEMVVGVVQAYILTFLMIQYVNEAPL